MTDNEQIAAGLATGAVITVATQAAGESATTSALIGGGAGLVLALTERSRAAGLALIAASLAGALARSQSRRLRLAR